MTSERDSGGDILDMAADGTTVPEDSAKPRYIRSEPRPDQIADAADANQLGGADFAGAADNAIDIPRTNRDTAGSDILTGTGDTLPAQVDSKRLHSVPGGVTHDEEAKGSMRYTAHKAHQAGMYGASSGPDVERAPGDEQLSDEAAMDKVEEKQ